MTISRHLFRFLKCDRGVAAIEMGIFAPILIVGTILMADVGLAVGARMDLDRNVRAGVQAAMSNVSDLNAIKDVVMASAEQSTAISVAVNKTCTCGSVVTSCTTWCEPEVPPSVFINISATEAYDGLMLPALKLESKTHVQLR
jgi:Flp pilus assembly protein TadG